MSLRIRLVLTVLLTTGAGALPAAACNVPVFRYALERWGPRPYEVVVFHRGPLPVEARKTVEWLTRRYEDPNSPCNVICRTADVGSPSAEHRVLGPLGRMDREAAALWQSQAAQADGKLPWMVVSYPQESPAEGVIWSGPLSQSSAEALVDSPLRRQIAQRILGGVSAVWVLLECGDKPRDDAAAALIQAELEKLAARIKLPEPDSDDWAEARSGARADKPPPKLRLAFALLRLSRQDPAEKLLVHMFQGSEPDLAAKLAGQPMVFPVYGRGRALFALVGKGINAENIAEACYFLAGPCTCDIRDRYTGVDLLIAADWEGGLERLYAAAETMPALEGIAGFARPTSRPATAAAGPASAAVRAAARTGRAGEEPFTVDVPGSVSPAARGEAKPPGTAPGLGFHDVLIIPGIVVAVVVSAVLAVVIVVLRMRKRGGAVP